MPSFCIRSCPSCRCFPSAELDLGTAEPLRTEAARGLKLPASNGSGLDRMAAGVITRHGMFLHRHSLRIRDDGRSGRDVVVHDGRESTGTAVAKRETGR